MDRASQSRAPRMLVVLASTLVASVAGAQEPSAPAALSKVECSKANADGQALRMTGKLAGARLRLEACQSPSCPAIVREDCATRLDEIDHVQPTIVFDVKDTAGADVSAVTVTMDGAPFAQKLLGNALRVDPGEHVFVFVAAAAGGQPTVSRTLVIREGDKDRHERVVLLAKPAAAPAPSPAAPSPEASTTSGSPPQAPADSGPSGLGTQKILGLVAGGVGIAAVAAGSVFGMLALSAANAQKSDCGGTGSCPNRAQAQSDHSTAATDSTISTVAFVAGGAMLAGGALLFFTATSAPQESARMFLQPSVGPTGAGMTLRGSFEAP